MRCCLLFVRFDFFNVCDIYFLIIHVVFFESFDIGLIITGDIVQLRSGELAINALHISERPSRVFNVPQHLSSCFLLLSISKVIPAGVLRLFYFL